jgi:hypothetical protein
MAKLKVWADGTTDDDNTQVIRWKSDDYITFDMKTPIELLIMWVGQEMAYFIIQDYLGY